MTTRKRVKTTAWIVTDETGESVGWHLNYSRQGAHLEMRNMLAGQGLRVCRVRITEIPQKKRAKGKK